MRTIPIYIYIHSLYIKARFGENKSKSVPHNFKVEIHMQHPIVQLYNFEVKYNISIGYLAMYINWSLNSGYISKFPYSYIAKTHGITPPPPPPHLFHPGAPLHQCIE